MNNEQQHPPSPPPPPPSQGHPAKKMQKTEQKTEQKGKANTVAPKPTPFPASVNLNPPTPSESNCIMNQLKTEVKKLTPLLIELGVAMDIDSPYLDSYKTDFLLMNRAVPCSYGVIDEGDDFNLNAVRKIGSTTDAQRRFSDEYKNKNMIGIILNDWGKYGEKVLDAIDAHINRCYSIIAKSFQSEGGFWKWISKATIQDCRDWEDKAGGLSIFFVMWMEFVLNHNGKKKRGIYKNLHIRIIEIANQLHYAISGGAQFEQLHYDIWDSFIIPNHEQVKKSTGQLMTEILVILNLGASTDLHFQMHSASVSWEPGITFNTLQELTRKLQTLFEGYDIRELSLEEMEDILSKEKVVTVTGEDDEDCEVCNLSVILEDIPAEMLEAVDSVLGLVELVYNAPDMNSKKRLHKTATELFYDFFFGVVNSRMKGHWKDPCERANKDNPYDASGLNYEEARENHRQTIINLRSTVDECKKDGHVFVALMDRMKTGYDGKHEGSLEEFILAPRQGFSEILKFGEYVTAYAYKSKTQNCLGLLLVHHAVSKALTSRPPYVSQGAVNGRKAVKDNSMAAVTGLFLHAVMMTVRDNAQNQNFEPTTMMLGNPVTAYAMIRYCLKRWHTWDSQVATMFGKAMLASDTELLSSKYGLEWTHRNSCEFKGGVGFSRLEEIALLLTGARDNNNTLGKAFELLKKDTSANFEQDLCRLQNMLHENGYLYNELLKRAVIETEDRQMNAEQDEAAKKEALAAELEKVKAAKRTGDEKGEHEVLARNSTKPKRKKK